jgi:hypothetical protein
MGLTIDSMCVTLSSLYWNYTVKHSLWSDSYGVNNRQHMCYLVESILQLHSQALSIEWFLWRLQSTACVLPCRVYTKTRKNCFRYLKLMSPLNKWYYLKNNYLTLRSKVKVQRRLLRYATRRLMVMHPHIKYPWPISKDKNVMVLTSFAEKKRKRKKLPSFEHSNTVKHSLSSDFYGVNNRQHVCYLVESMLKLQSNSLLSDSYGVNNRQDVCYLFESMLKLHKNYSQT